MCLGRFAADGAALNESHVACLDRVYGLLWMLHKCSASEITRRGRDLMTVNSEH